MSDAKDSLFGDVDEFARRATQVSNAFEELRAALKEDAIERPLPELGEIVGGRYVLERKLGEGGFGSVFEVRHHLLGRRFAMKLLNPRIGADPDWVARFEEEARATSMIGHESIVYVTDFGTDDDWGSYFVMEYLDGTPLDAVLEDEGPQPPERVSRFAHAAAGALGAVHDLGIVHCDLKPSNVFVVPRQGRAELFKFLDFGTSTVVLDAVETDALYGTPRYMAPEQAVGMQLTPQADQFALAVIVYEMLTGQLPWTVESWLQATPMARKQRPPAPPSERSNCPPAWDRAILRALSIEPTARFPDVGAFVDALVVPDTPWQPAIDPLDVGPRAGQDLSDFARTMTAPSVQILSAQQSLEERSVDVAVDDDDPGEVFVRIHFKSQDRFLREWRRNLNVGGLFVPSDELVPLRDRVRLELRCGPHTCELSATVVGHEPRAAAGRGFGVAIEPQARAALDAFFDATTGERLRPDAQLVLGRAPEPSEELSPGEGFVLSRIGGPTTTATLRAMCAGLPFDIDELLEKLIQRGLLAKAGEGSARAPDQLAAGNRKMSSDNVSGIIERFEFHRRQGNFLAAAEVLTRAIEVDPDVAEFHRFLADIRFRFQQDRASALQSARRAVELEPDNVAFRALLDEIEQSP